MTNRAIRELAAFFVILFLVLAIRQAYVQLVVASAIAQRPSNPRHALLDANRGRIVASDGTVLAQTQAGKREYPLGAQTAALVGYVSQRYGTSGIEIGIRPCAHAPGRQRRSDRATRANRGRASRLYRRRCRRGHRHDDRSGDPSRNSTQGCRATAGQRVSFWTRRREPSSRSRACRATIPTTSTLEFPTLRDDARAPLLDRALDGLYPPGSTFKIFTASAALDSGTVTVDSHFEDPGYLQIGDFTLHDNESEATGYAGLTTAFALSSNVDFAQIALKMGVNTFYDYLNRWGIGAPLDFQLPAEPARVPPKAEIVPGELAQMGFGQGALLVSPLQMALIGATIANAGEEPRPYVVRQVVRDGIPASVSATATLTNPVSSDTAAKVTNMMIAVVQRGTGTPAQLPHVIVAGKTGTATNPLGRSHAWFVCFAPALHPRVAVAIVVENVGYGATYAAPIARDVLKTALENTGN